VIAPQTSWLILPTYEEAENLDAVVASALAHLPRPRRILVVDDNSPDGTGELAEHIAAERQEVSVLHRSRKEGLGRAYVAGFRAALAGGADLVLQMDADFSHDPADLPRLVEATQYADLALGSRYVPGGGTANWGWPRRAISRGGSAYARRVLGLEVRDLTGGFKCFRRQVLQELDLDSMRAHGYAFQVETTYRALQAGFRVAEVPITFRDRRVGESKMSKAILAEAVWRVPAMRLQSRRRFRAAGPAGSHSRPGAV
jgi:dolichol-phosphate mannosyltransferase